VAAILVVDSDVDQLGLIRTTLEANGHAPCLAGSALQAGDQLRDGGIDMLVVHYAAGLDLEQLSANLARLPDPPPFVLISGALDGPTMSARHGAAEFVARPVRAEELMRAITRVLDSRARPDAFEDVPTRPNERRGSF
jgi:DNA-binding NtrC family response regulator